MKKESREKKITDFFGLETKYLVFYTYIVFMVTSISFCVTDN